MGLAVLITACPKNEFVPPPPPSVTVAPPEVRDVTVHVGFPGRSSARDTIDIVARVPGFLEKIEFTDGEMVEEGQVLFIIEQEPYEAALSRAKASLAQAEASERLAGATLSRKQQAYERRAVAEIEVLAAQAEQSSATAAVLSAKAAIEQAELDLSYTTITAPMAGRISAAELSPGNMVGATATTHLATIVVDEELFVNFNVDERTAIPIMADGREMDIPEDQRMKVRLELADGTLVAQEAQIDYADPDFNPDTGTIGVRAKVGNEAGALAAGMFMRVLIPQERPGAILVPDLAVQRDLSGPYVLLVNNENVVEYREVTPGPRVDAQRIIEEGLDGSERIVVAGIQRAREGIEVAVTEQGDEATESAGPESGAETPAAEELPEEPTSETEAETEETG
jgi:RND family efflux transporter MFP subunit